MGHSYIEATEETFADEVEKFSGVAMVDFWATWCGPCLMMAPAIEQIGEQYKGNDKVKIVKVDVDQNPTLAEKYQIQSIPNIKYFKDGQIVDETVGVMPAGELARHIDAALA